jgi:hypothetical protein
LNIKEGKKKKGRVIQMDRVSGLEHDEVESFIDFLVRSGYSIDIAMCGGEHSLTILDNYNEDLFFFDTSNEDMVYTFIRNAINCFIATDDGAEMLTIWTAQ